MTTDLSGARACPPVAARGSRATALVWMTGAVAALALGCAEPTDARTRDGRETEETDQTDARLPAADEGARETATRDAGGRATGSDASNGPRDAGSREAGARDARADSSGAGPDAGRTDVAVDSGSGNLGGPDAGGSRARKKFVGNITTRGQVPADFAAQWDQITPENEGKWGSVEASRNQMNWSGLDRVHDYAKQHGLLFKQHTLLWGSQQPAWLAGLSAAQQRAEVEEWIRLFCERYPDVALIDVVNEPPPHTTPVYLEALGGAGQSGYDWIVQGFKWARQYCPKAVLIINDYNNIEYAGDNTRFIGLVNALKAAGAPLDAVGAQAHDAYKLPTDTVQKLLSQLASSTGLPVYISEYDIDLADDARQRQVMESQFTMFWNDDRVRGITLWGYVVGATWRPNTGLVTSGGSQRPALDWLRDFLEKSSP